MKQINNYISEKLYIGKGYGKDFPDVTNYKTMLKYLEYHGIEITEENYDKYRIIYNAGKESPEIILRYTLTPDDDSFIISTHDDTKKGIVKVSTGDWQWDCNKYNANEIGMERYDSFIKVDGWGIDGLMKPFKTNKHNADLIIQLLNNEIDK